MGIDCPPSVVLTEYYHNNTEQSIPFWEYFFTESHRTESDNSDEKHGMFMQFCVHFFLQPLLLILALQIYDISQATRQESVG